MESHFCPLLQRERNSKWQEWNEVQFHVAFRNTIEPSCTVDFQVSQIRGLWLVQITNVTPPPDLSHWRSYRVFRIHYLGCAVSLFLAWKPNISASFIHLLHSFWPGMNANISAHVELHTFCRLYDNCVKRHALDIRPARRFTAILVVCAWNMLATKRYYFSAFGESFFLIACLKTLAASSDVLCHSSY